MPDKLSSAERQLQKLVSFRSVSNNQSASKALLDYIESELAELQLHISRYESGGFPSLIATSKAGFKPKLWLVGHIDVVAADDEMFSLKIGDDKLVGRGVIDDKCAAAAFVDAIQSIGNDATKYDFGVMLVSDEELGSDNGVRHIMASLDVGGEVAFVPDSGLGWDIQTRAKGGLHIKLTMQGQAAHGSMPWAGRNAIDQLYSAIESLRKALKIPDAAEAKQKFLMTLNIGNFVGGKAANQVPEMAEAIIDIRFVDSSEAKTIRKAVENLKTTYPDLSSTELVYASAVAVEPNNQWLAVFKSILGSHGINPGFSSSTGATDARFFAEAGIPTIVSQPGGGNLHAADEWIDRKDFNAMSEIVKKLILKT